jgi:hypothetical protein
MPARQRAMDLAYSDVLRALTQFRAWNNGTTRPLILLGHSQGSYILARLLRDIYSGRIDGSDELKSQLVAAYLIGAALLPEDVPIPVCDTPEALACVVGYNACVHGGNASNLLIARSMQLTKEEAERIICVNPLSWQHNEQKAPAHLNNGSRPIRILHGVRTGNYMGKLQEGMFSARCDKGILWTEAPSDSEAGWEITSGYPFPMFPARNYHGAELSFFFLSHRDNAQLRLSNFLAKHRERMAMQRGFQ